MKQEPFWEVDTARVALGAGGPGFRREPAWHQSEGESAAGAAASNSRPSSRASRQPAPPSWDDSLRHATLREPSVDVTAGLARIPLRKANFGAFIHVPSFLLSLALHSLVIALTVYGIDLEFLRRAEDTAIVEVTFGVEVPSQVRAQPPKPEDPKAQTPPQPDEGTKLPEQLPQLPERFDINTKPPEAEANDMPLPDDAKAEVPAATPTPSAATPPPATPDPKAIAAPERDKDARKIDINEVIERMKREDRKVADKDKDGANKIPDSPFAKPSDLPPNPLAQETLPKMPETLVPSGSLAGRKLAGSALEAYKTSAMVHMKRNWNIPGVYQFPAGLEAVAVVVVDLFGKIRSLSIEKSSGNSAFDELVLKQIRAAEPFPDFPDNSVRTEKLYMKFNPQSIE